MGNSFCGSHSEVGVEPESNARAASSAESHKVTIEVRDERSREVQVAREASLQASLFSLVLDAFSFLMVALFARHEVISDTVAGVLLGGIVGSRIVRCQLPLRVRCVAAVTSTLLGLWGFLTISGHR